MISHIFLGSDQLERAQIFYGPILGALGWKLRYANLEVGRLAWQPAIGGRPYFVVGKPFDGEPATVGNGTMAALLAPDRDTVQRVHDLALGLGATNEGAPGLRPHYHPNYYGAYFRDPHGHKVCVCCHGPATGEVT
jgi:catechol 2,3-dioxygenase-like lactoylglutathione lyase family enzyme